MEKKVNKSQKNTNKKNGIGKKIIAGGLTTALTFGAVGLSAKEKILKTNQKDLAKIIQFDEVNNNNTDLSHTNITSLGDFTDKIPPKMKKLYKKLNNINSKDDFDKLVLTKEELWYLANIAPKYLDTKKGQKFLENLEKVFGYRGSFDVYTSDFGGLKLITFTLGGEPIFCINNTLAGPVCGTWTMDGESIVVDKIGDKVIAKTLKGDVLDGRYVIHYNGNLVSTDDNGDYKGRAFLFRDGGFKNTFGELNIDPRKSPDEMIKYKYGKKKDKISYMMPSTKSLQDRGYNLVWDDNNMRCKLEKGKGKSKYSDPILSYKTDKDFEKRLKEAQKSVDGVLEYEQGQEEIFVKFYEKYFGGTGIYKQNERYKIEREGSSGFYLLDRTNRNKKISNNAFSIFDNKGNMISNFEIDAMIDKYEAEDIYIKFIAANNKSDVVNLHGEHKINEYYLGYDFLYKGYRISLDRSSFTDWRYSVMVHEKDSEKYVGHFHLDNYMSSSDIKNEIEDIIK